MISNKAFSVLDFAKKIVVVYESHVLLRVEVWKVWKFEIFYFKLSLKFEKFEIFGKMEKFEKFEKFESLNYFKLLQKTKKKFESLKVWNKIAIQTVEEN